MKKPSNYLIVFLIISLVVNLYLSQQLLVLKDQQLHLLDGSFQNLHASIYSTRVLLEDVLKTNTITADRARMLENHYFIYLVDHLHDLDRNIQIIAKSTYGIDGNKLIGPRDFVRALIQKPYESTERIYPITSEERSEITRIVKSLSQIQDYIRANHDMGSANNKKRKSSTTEIKNWFKVIERINRHNN